MARNTISHAPKAHDPTEGVEPDADQAVATPGESEALASDDAVRAPAHAQTPHSLLSRGKNEAERPAEEQPKRYRVTRGGMVIFQNCRMEIPVGREYLDHAVDIEHLRRSGIVLEEVV